MKKLALSICLLTNLNEKLEHMLCQYRTGLEVCASLEEAESRLGKKHFCLIVFDTSAVTVERTLQGLERIRQATNTPILLLAPPELEIDFIEAGADRCISASKAYESITWEAFSLLRRYTLYNHYDKIWPPDSVIFRGGLVFDHLRHHVSLDGEEIHLTPKEYTLLYHFLRNPGIVFSADQICDSVWGGQFDENRDVTSVIAELRRKLKDTQEEAIYIKTVQGSGYQFLSQE